MPNKYADDIRRIVGTEAQDGSLAEAKERERIQGGRGVGYYSGGGGQVSGSTGYPTGQGAGLPGDSANNPQGDNSTSSVGGDGTAEGGISGGREGAFDPSNPYSLITEFGNSQTDIADLMDNWSYNSLDSLRTITGTDPGTGTDIEVYTNGFYPPPEGWDDPNVPPTDGEPDPTWQAGYYWEHLSALVDDQYATPSQAHSAFVSAHAAFVAQFGNAYEYDPLQQVSIDTYQSCFRQIQSNGNPIPPGPTSCIDIARQGCTPSDPDGPGDYCSLTPPGTEPPSFWPELNKIITLFTGATSEVNEYQAPADLVGYTQAGASKLNLESSKEPGRYFSIEPTGTGGTLVYETATPGGAPTGVYKTFGPDGRFTGFGDSSSIDYIRPDSQ